MSLLNRYLRNTRQWLAFFIKGHGVPDDKYLRVFGNTEVILDTHSASTVRLRLQPFARRRGRHARGPDHSLAGNSFSTYHDAFCVN